MKKNIKEKKEKWTKKDPKIKNIEMMNIIIDRIREL